jgi:hypothetical protein
MAEIKLNHALAALLSLIIFMALFKTFIWQVNLKRQEIYSVDGSSGPRCSNAVFFGNGTSEDAYVTSCGGGKDESSYMCGADNRMGRWRNYLGILELKMPCMNCSALTIDLFDSYDPYIETVEKTEVSFSTDNITWIRVGNFRINGEKRNITFDYPIVAPGKEGYLYIRIDDSANHKTGVGKRYNWISLC